MKILLTMAAAAAVLVAAPARANDTDKAMTDLATRSGCLTCHHIQPGSKGPDGLAPIGPAWREVAAKYKGNPQAADALTQTVMKGSNPYDSHWKGKVSGLAMPPNAVAIQQADAARLVRWILALTPAPAK